MRRILFALAVLCGSACAQVGNGLVSYVFTAPSGSCSQSSSAQFVIGLGTLYTCQSGTWAQVGAGGGGSGTVTSVSVTTANGVSGTVATATTTPAITLTLGAITPSSIAATGIVDGRAPVTITTGTTATLGGTFQSGYTLNQEATAGTAVTYTLPVAAAGKQYCVKNSYNGAAGTTGVLTLITSATGQFLIYNGVISATHGQIVSGGALGDAVCAVGVDATHWEIYTQQGTWTLT